jgi:hypothetical protein
VNAAASSRRSGGGRGARGGRERRDGRREAGGGAGEEGGGGRRKGMAPTGGPHLSVAERERRWEAGGAGRVGRKQMWAALKKRKGGGKSEVGRGWAGLLG